MSAPSTSIFAWTATRTVCCARSPRSRTACDINVELAGPLDFLPEPDGWRERSPSVGRFGGLEVFHTDFALQALSKIERGSPQDLDDVRAMLDRGLTDAHAIRRTFETIRPELYRFPAVDADRLAAQVTAALPG